MLLNKDINKIIFNFLKIPEKFNFHKLCLKENLSELKFTQTFIDNLHQISPNSWIDIIIDNENELSDEFIEIYKEKIDWYILCIYQKFSDNFIINNHEFIRWETFVIHQKISKNILIKFQKKINWDLYSTNSYINEDIIETFDDKFNWEFLKIKNFSDKFIKKYMNKINWSNLTFDDLDRYSLYEQYVDWEKLSYYEELSEKFMTKHEDKLNWGFISGHQKLSKEFIKKYEKKLNMDKVFFFQKMREIKKKDTLFMLPSQPSPLILQHRINY